MQSHLIDSLRPLVCRPVYWSVLRAGGEGSAVKQKATNPDSPLQEMGCACEVWGWQGQVDLSQAEPFISYAGAYVLCLRDIALDAVD